MPCQGLAVADQGATIYTSGTGGKIFVAHRNHARDPYQWSAAWSLPNLPKGGDSAPTGLALTMDGNALLALSGRGNTLWRLNRRDGNFIGKPIAVGVAPFGIALFSDAKAYVTNWGGEHPNSRRTASASSKTPVRIDPKTGAAASGSVSVVDLKAGKTVKAITTGLHPSGLALSKDRRFLYVACANSDTDRGYQHGYRQIGRDDRRSTRGSASIWQRAQLRWPLSADGGLLYVANGTNNAVAVVDLGPKASTHPRLTGPSRTIGFHPGWMVSRRDRCSHQLASSGIRRRQNREQLIVANIKGQGSRHRKV